MHRANIFGRPSNMLCVVSEGHSEHYTGDELRCREFLGDAPRE